MPALTSENFFLVLASGSPRRRELINLLGLPFSVITPKQLVADGQEAQEINETPLPGEAPPALVQRLSRIKAGAVMAALPALLPAANQPPKYPIIIAADTIVVMGNQILGKPEDAAAARQMLKQLRQERHLVYTGFTIAIPARSRATRPPNNVSLPEQDRFITRLHRSQVWLRPYTDAEIEAYIAGGSPLDKAGAYGIQDEPFAPVAHLDGCFASVMGLPLGEVAATLAALGLSLPPIAPLCSQFTGAPCCREILA